MFSWLGWIGVAGLYLFNAAWTFGYVRACDETDNGDALLAAIVWPFVLACVAARRVLRIPARLGERTYRAINEEREYEIDELLEDELTKQIEEAHEDSVGNG